MAIVYVNQSDLMQVHVMSIYVTQTDFMLA
jgi:hypothetical protein